MRLSFDSLSLHRFRSFNEEATIDFDELGSGLHFLKGRNQVNPTLGSNGAGKSSLLEALMWCLYGKTVHGLRNTDITPWTGKGQTVVQLDVSIDGKTHTIKRTANPNTLSLDDRDVGQDTIDKLVGLSFEVMPYTLILGQGCPLFFDLAPKAKMDLFMSVLDLERWEQRSELAKGKTEDYLRDIDRLTNEIENYQRDHEQIADDANRLKAQSRTWEDERTARLKSNAQERDKLQGQIEAVMKEHGKADLIADGAGTELNALRPKLDSSIVDADKLRAKIMHAQTQRAERNFEVARCRKALESFERDDAICPTCNQKIVSPAKLKALKLEYQKKLDAAEDKKADRALTSDCDNLQMMMVMVKALQKTQRDYERDENAAREILDRLNPKIAEWQAQIKALDKLKDEREDQTNPYTEQIQNLRKRSELNQKALKDAESMLVTIQRRCERVRYWIKGFKDIRLYIIDEILQELELATNAMCDEFGLLGWNIHYDVERETKSGTISRGLNVTVLSPQNKHAVRWECWSGGEAQRLRIIGALALSETLLNHAGVTADLEILDEPSRGLSKEGVDDLIDSLAERARRTKRKVFFVDHMARESAKFASVLMVNRDSQGSHLVLA